MRFKWVKFYLKPFNSFYLVVLSSFLWGATHTNAQVMVSPSGKGGATLPQPLIGSGTIYYFVTTNGVPAPADYLPAFALKPVIDVGPSASVALENSLDNIVELVFTTNLTTLTALPSPQQYVVTLQASGSGGNSNPQLVPIASSDGIACSGGAACQSKDNNFPNFYFAAKYYPNITVTKKIGFYPRDLCAAYGGQLSGIGTNSSSFNGGGGSATGCTGTVMNTVSAGNPVTMQLTLSIRTVPDGILTSFPGTATQDTLTSPVTISFQQDVPTFICPSPPESAYTAPGDAQVTINTGAFGLTPPNDATTLAPAANLVVFGNDHNGAPKITTDDSMRTSNENTVYQSVPYGGSASVSGFTNSTSLTSDDHPYQISFMVQDQTGMFIPPGPAGGSADATLCSISNVRAVPVGAFFSSKAIKEKNLCFVATATYQSESASPVVMLREFRDRILLANAWGKRFVHWYYQWSPQAADWLTEHSYARFGVLILLNFLEAVAWLSLHPLYLGLSLVGGLLILMLGVFSYRFRGSFE